MKIIYIYFLLSSVFICSYYYNTLFPKDSFIKIVVYDMLGLEVETLVNEKQTAGTYEAVWNASQFPSGVYFYKLKSDNFIETKRMLLIK